MGRFDHIQPEGPAAPAEAKPEEQFDFAHYANIARKAHLRGQFEGALRHWGRALERDRGRPEAWSGQVLCLLDMGQPEEAFAWLEQACKVAGERAEFLALRAVACARTGQSRDALAWSDRSLKDGPDQPEVWLARAEVLYRAGQDRIAASALDKAHERAPGGLTCRRCGEVALAVGDLARARTWLERALRQDPESPLVALRLGVLWERLGDWERATAELNRALSLEPEMAPARLALDDLNRRPWWQRLANRAKGAWNGKGSGG